MAPLEPWEKVYVKQDKIAKTFHGQMQCTFCHGGTLSPDMDTAHKDMIADPSAPSDPKAGTKNVCATCHSDQETHFAKSLHATQAGYWDKLNARSLPENHPALQNMFDNHCATCHTTCGNCHVSQPGNVGGGLVDGHAFNKTPSMTQNCTACHGSRVGAEYLGQHDGIPGDVHFRNGRMNCIDCHSGTDMHGGSAQVSDTSDALNNAPTNLGKEDNRYSGAQIPSCESCHQSVGQAGDPNSQHTIHTGKLSCQVCHSVQYSSCDGCHVALSQKSGQPYFETQATYFTFYIGKNPIKNEYRPYDYVTVRHIPVDPQSYAYYGENLLSKFDSLPTWQYTTPHNIQLKTPQNASCTACHGNTALFLTEDKVKPEEIQANQPVIVPEIPAQP